jgi:hypothetical protein
MNVHVALPDLFWPDPADAPGPRGRFPALERLLARGRRTAGGERSLEAWLLARWGLADAGAAPYALLADGGEPRDAWWLCAEPCSFRVNLDHLLPIDATQFAIAPAEARALVEALNRHFAGSGLRLLPLAPARWYLESRTPLASRAPALAAARGRRLDNPAGREDTRFNALANEIQMVLHAHPVNEARESRGEPPINGLWLWGGGRLLRPATRAFARVRSSMPLAAGLAAAAGGAALPLPEDGARWLETAPREGIELLVLDALRAPAAYGDATGWAERLARLEREWFAPLVTALRASRIGMVTLHAVGAGGALDVETTRQDLRFFWRRPRPVAAYAVLA